MAAVANATGLTPAPDGLVFPPCGTHELADILHTQQALLKCADHDRAEQRPEGRA